MTRKRSTSPLGTACRHSREQTTIRRFPFLAPVSGRFDKPLLVDAAGSLARFFLVANQFPFLLGTDNLLLLVFPFGKFILVARRRGRHMGSI
jgi:hypothetical protein